MTATNAPISKVSVEKRNDGVYFFLLVFRGVTYPAQGPFSNPLQAAAAGQSVLKTLEAQADAGKRS